MASQSRASGLEDLTHIRYRTIVGREDVMLTRPGSTPGSGWMRDLSERLAGGPADPSGSRSLPRSYWLVYCFDGHDSRCRTDDVPASHSARATGPRVFDRHCPIS